MKLLYDVIISSEFKKEQTLKISLRSGLVKQSTCANILQRSFCRTFNLSSTVIQILTPYCASKVSFSRCLQISRILVILCKKERNLMTGARKDSKRILAQLLRNLNGL